MSKLIWDKTGERFYETGVSNVALYVKDATGAYGKGVPWNGVTSISESPSGAEANPQYADNIKYLNLMSAEEFAATLEALTYPDEFGICDGSLEVGHGVYAGQQTRRGFGLAYKTLIGNDILGQEFGYKIHLMYNGLAAPSEKAYASVNDSPEASAMSWEISTSPEPITTVPGAKPTATLTIDSTKTDPAKLAALEAILYGDATTEPKLPSPDEVIALIPIVG